MQISVRSNIKEVTKSLSALEKKYIPKATRNAINETLFGLGKALSQEMRSVFDEPTSFTTGTDKRPPFVYEKAGLKKLAGEIRFKKIQASYLRWQVKGGVQRPSGTAIPVPQRKYQAKHGGLKPKWKSVLNKPDHFSGTVKKLGGGSESRPGIFKITKKGKWSKREERRVGRRFELVIGWERQAKYEERFHFYDYSRRFVRKNFMKNFREKLRWYVQNRG